MALPNEKAFNGNVTFEMLFNSSSEGGGISDAWIYGNARFMDAMNIHAPCGVGSPGQKPNGSAMSANVDLHMDFNKKHFHGQLEVYLDAGFLKGSGPGNQLGFAEVSIKPGDWYIKIGKPFYGFGEDNRVGMDINVPVIGNIAGFRAYLQIGKNLDPMPPLPAHILQLTGATDVSSLNQRSDLTGTGDGFIFGSEINLGSKDYTFAIFKASLAAELGFDISVLDYGSGATCTNLGGQQLGINGWYAQGQVWAGLDVALGIRVKVFGGTKEFTILDMAAAMALQAKLPNPFWAQGAVGADYNLLGGLVKGHCDFQFTIGEICEIANAGNPYENVGIIQLTNPTENQEVGT
ncbi:MAG: hypothetical protein AAB316_05920, partial [Bacteroidota bacterium]